MKRAVRRRTFTVSPEVQQSLRVFAGVLLVVLFLASQQKKQGVSVQPVVIGQQSTQRTHSASWNHLKGWWGGYWWGADSFFWKGREWGIGKSRYPWYWEYDTVAIRLHLAELAKKGRWQSVESAILKKINELEKEASKTENKASKRKLQRTIQRLEYYLYNAQQYRKAQPRL